MTITHTIVAQGHYINIKVLNLELSIRTEDGTAQELLDYAAGEERRAHRILRDAALARKAAEALEAGPC